MALINKLSLLNGFTHVSLNPLQNKHSCLHGNAQLQSGILSCTGSNSGKLIAWKGSCLLLSTVLLCIWQTVWIVMVVVVSLNYCVTEYNGVTDTEKLWCHYIFHSTRLARGTNHLPVPFVTVILERL